MFVDASALTAILADEGDAAILLQRIEHHPLRLTSALAVWETVVALARIFGRDIAAIEVDVYAFLQLMEIDIMPVGGEIGHLALKAFDRYGKGRHPAALNFGDCFAYACAGQQGLPLLYKGEDFPQTDITAA